ncbi:MAG: glucose 1-dehydrogenase [Phycisphaeraceae bacterium]|nr:glucose 1-dehydrogenase [Phycisphaeraceae bacterium]MBX3366377.1 glucose 1-dehydrogenase [Phycisphaeraceae bacterium]
MAQRFSGKVVLVTGATSGIGRATVLALAREGAKVAFTGRRDELGKALEKEVNTIAPGSALYIRVDHALEADNKRAVDETVNRFGRLDGAVNNAAVEGTAGPIAETSADIYKQVFDINVLGVLMGMKHQVPAMLKSGGGSIVNTTSGLGHVGMAHMHVYTGSKHAVEGITKSVALELAQKGIRVNTVAPGGVATEMNARAIVGEEARKAFDAFHPVGRIAQSPEIAAPILFLLSDESSFVTGTSLLVDGGITAQ